MSKIYVPDMHCENCVKRITAALKEAGIDATVELASQTRKNSQRRVCSRKRPSISAAAARSS